MNEAREYNAAEQALQVCLDVMLRMIPDYCEEHAAEICSQAEHDAAIAKAGTVLYGRNRRSWPAGVRAAASGRYP